MWHRDVPIPLVPLVDKELVGSHRRALPLRCLHHQVYPLDLVEDSDCGSAYSTMILQKDGRVGFLYEEEPGWYNIVYAPLTIETITGGLYTIDMK